MDAQFHDPPERAEASVVEIDFAGYGWLTRTQDGDPTEEDLAKAQEQLADATAPGSG